MIILSLPSCAHMSRTCFFTHEGDKCITISCFFLQVHMTAGHLRVVMTELPSRGTYTSAIAEPSLLGWLEDSLVLLDCWDACLCCLLRQNAYPCDYLVLPACCLLEAGIRFMPVNFAKVMTCRAFIQIFQLA